MHPRQPFPGRGGVWHLRGPASRADVSPPPAFPAPPAALPAAPDRPAPPAPPAALEPPAPPAPPAKKKKKGGGGAPELPAPPESPPTAAAGPSACLTGRVRRGSGATRGRGSGERCENHGGRGARGRPPQKRAGPGEGSLRHRTMVPQLGRLPLGAGLVAGLGEHRVGRSQDHQLEQAQDDGRESLTPLSRRACRANGSS